MWEIKMISEKVELVDTYLKPKWVESNSMELRKNKSKVQLEVLYSRIF